MKDIIHSNIEDVSREHVETEGYEYYKRRLLPRGSAEQLAIFVYEIPPGKAAIPYHYHMKNEEIFFIMNGEGELRTPSGCRAVKAGEFIYFPANENGAHKLTNTSETEMLVYMDIDTTSDLDVTFYPDSGKMGVWGKEINKLYREGDDVDYYDGE